MSQITIPKDPHSLWQAGRHKDSFPALDRDIHVDVSIIGGGVTGLTSAYVLAKKGLKVALIEADQLLSGTTGYTTAKVSSQHGAIYQKLIKQFGEREARLYYEANEMALTFIRETIEAEKIEAELETKDALIYATSNDYAKVIEKEAKAYESLNIKGILEEGDVGLPFKVKKACALKNKPNFIRLLFSEDSSQPFFKMAVRSMKVRVFRRLKEQMNRKRSHRMATRSQANIVLLAHTFQSTIRQGSTSPVFMQNDPIA